MKDFKLKKLNESHIEEVADLIAEVYARDQPLCVYEEQRKERLKQFFYHKVQQGCKNGFSYAYYHEHQMVSVLTTISLQRFLQLTSPDFPQMRNRMALDKQLHQGFIPEPYNEIIYGLQAATKLGYQNYRFFEKLIFVASEQVCRLGYKKLLASAFHNKSEKVLGKNIGSIILNEINVREFEFEGKKPYQDIKDCEKVILFLGRLPHAMNPTL